MNESAHVLPAHWGELWAANTQTTTRRNTTGVPLQMRDNKGAANTAGRTGVGSTRYPALTPQSTQPTARLL